jgi:hypothetical protein
MMAVVYSEGAERKRAAAQQEIGDLKGLFTDLKIRLEQTFTFTIEQRVHEFLLPEEHINLTWSL